MEEEWHWKYCRSTFLKKTTTKKKKKKKKKQQKNNKKKQNKKKSKKTILYTRSYIRIKYSTVMDPKQWNT